MVMERFNPLRRSVVLALALLMINLISILFTGDILMEEVPMLYATNLVLYTAILHLIMNVLGELKEALGIKYMLSIDTKKVSSKKS